MRRLRRMAPVNARAQMPIPLSARLDGSGVSGGPPWPVGGGGPPGSVDPPIQWLVTSDPFSLKSITCAAKKTDSPPDEGRVKWARVASLPSPVISTTTFGVSLLLVAAFHENLPKAL